MASKALPTPEALRNILSYDPETGVLTWRCRPAGLFKCERDAMLWNAKNAGRQAFTCLQAGYLAGAVFGKTIRAHRVIWALHYGKWPDQDIDHISGDRTDNRIANLRCVSRAENCRNKTRQVRNKSGRTGVHWCTTNSKWVASICFNAKSRHLGMFRSLAKAIEARARAERALGFHANHDRLKS